MEIERKWMVEGWPAGLPLVEEYAMRQGYISVRPTVRIREEARTGGETAWVLCFKSAGGLAREEIERPIDKELFDDLAGRIITRPLIEKVRRTYLLPDGSHLEVNHVDAGQPGTPASRASSFTPKWSLPAKPKPAPGSPKAAAWAITWPMR